MNRARTKLFLGIAASGGVRQGKAFVIASGGIAPDTGASLKRIKSSTDERRRLDVAVAHAHEALAPYRADLGRHTLGRELFEAHLLMLSDPVFHKQAQELIDKQAASAESAVKQLIHEWKTKLAGAQDTYLRERVSEFDFVERTLLAHLAHGAEPAARVPSGAVVFARSLNSVDIALLGHHHVKALVLEEGGVTAHAAILARALRIPAVMGVCAIVDVVRPGEWVTVDGDRGSILFEARAATADRTSLTPIRKKDGFDRRIPKTTYEKARTRDGANIELLAAIDQVERAGEAFANGAQGVGLFRTEFLFGGRHRIEDATQLKIYRELVDITAGRPLTIRLFDFGGDKGSGLLHNEAERNPALGERGIRLALREKDRLRAQLQALLQLDAGPPLQILVPMVTSAEELREVHTLIAAARGEVAKRRGAATREIVLGAMLEVPSAAMTMDALAQEVDFFAVGANDLLHYLFAIDRNNPRVSHLYRPHHPAVCRLFASIVEQAKQLQRPLRLCGEAAGDLRLTPLLLGLGFRSLCVDPKKLLELRDIIATINLAESQHLATQACLETSPEGVAKLFDLSVE